jgi:hypothetical protein
MSAPFVFCFLWETLYGLRLPLWFKVLKTLTTEAQSSTEKNTGPDSDAGRIQVK